MPPGYLDLRYKGVGLVLDFGWRRTEVGMEWEVEDRRIAQMRLDEARSVDKRMSSDDEDDEEEEEEGLRDEQRDMIRVEKSWKDRVLGIVNGRVKSTNGMFSDW